MNKAVSRLSKICLFLLGMALIQASFGQVNQITKLASVPVTTEYRIVGSTGVLDYTWMLENWQRNELYVSYRKGVQVLNTETLSVSTIPLALSPAGMCLDKTTGKIVVIDDKSNVSSEITFNVIDPGSGTSQSKRVATAEGQFVYCNVCSFGLDGKTLYFGNRVSEYSESAKLIAVDTATWKIAWTWADVKRVSAILPLPNGKVYFIAEYPIPYKPSISDLWVLDFDGLFKKVDLGELMPKTLNLGPNGHLYVSGLEIDPATNEILNSSRLTRDYVSWASGDSGYAYVASSLAFVDVANKSTIAYVNDVLAHGLATKREPDGSDSIAVLTNGSVDFYKYTPDVPLGVITAVTDLYYWLAPVVSTRYTEGDVITIWGEKLCVNFPIPLQLPYPNPLRTEIAECSVLLTDSKGTNFLGSLYVVANGNQINVQLPFGLSGIVKMSVKNGSSTSSPVFLSIKGKPSYVQYAKDGIGYLATLHNSDGSLVTAENPPRPGEVIQIYAVGLGETSPIIPAGELGIAPIVGKIEAVISGIPADVIWAGLQGQWPGLYQANVIVPEGIDSKPPTVGLKNTFKDGTVHESPTFLLESPK